MTLLGKYEELHARGTAQTDIIAAMRADDLSIVEAIVVARSVFGVSLSVAKEVVSGHAAWLDIARQSEALHAAAEEFFESP